MDSLNEVLNNEERGLKKIYLKSEYNTDEDNIVKDLYHPCLKESIKYDRAVGYFRANIYRELGEDLLDFSIRGGKIRLVCSPDIPEADELAAREGYELRGIRTTQEIKITLLKVMESMSKNPDEKDCLNMLRLLIENENLDLYVATRVGGIYHRKIGLFVDPYNNKVVFSGSGNETSRAISPIEDWGNDEDFDIYRSWGENYEKNKVITKEHHLNNLFNNNSYRTQVRPLYEIEREYLQKFREHKSYEDSRLGAKKRSAKLKKERINNIQPYPYQVDAINEWKKADNIGIITMATGTGKTYTALFAIENILNTGTPILILVPSRILIDQWKEDINKIYPKVPLLIAGGGYNWRNVQNKRIFISDVKKPKIILATMDTAISDDFIQYIKQAKNMAIIIDEAHRVGSEKRRLILEIPFIARLGLSATPERLFDRAGSRALELFFGEELIYKLPIDAKVKLSSDEEHEYPILGTFLSRYNYNYYTVYLTNEEQNNWNALTDEIRRQMAIEISHNENFDVFINDRIKLLLINRSRIIKKARNKILIIPQIIKDEYPSNGKWIIYCEDEDQLMEVINSLKNNCPNITLLQYHSKMNSQDRDLSLDYFKNNSSVLVSIRCLDEGLNIPDANGAVILASSKNPRQYIQRRGRVLRKVKGKDFAHIIDVIVLPNNDDEEIPYSIVRGELARAWDFSKNAMNKDIAHELWRLCLAYNVNIETDLSMSMEDEDFGEYVEE